jgi:hypothetical protein
MPASRSSFATPASDLTPGQYRNSQVNHDRVIHRQQFNPTKFRRERGSRFTPYPTTDEVFSQSNLADAGRQGFTHLFLYDFVKANKRVAQHRLARRKDRMSNNLWHLLDRGAQDEMDVDEPGQLAPIVSALIGYTAAVGVAVMEENLRLKVQVCVPIPSSFIHC